MDSLQYKMMKNTTLTGIGRFYECIHLHLSCYPCCLSQRFTLCWLRPALNTSLSPQTSISMSTSVLVLDDSDVICTRLTWSNLNELCCVPASFLFPFSHFLPFYLLCWGFLHSLYPVLFLISLSVPFLSSVIPLSFHPWVNIQQFGR